MTSLTPLFAAALAVACALAWIAVQAPRALPARLGALALAALFLPLAHLSQAELLGRPKPARLERLGVEAPDATVLGSSLAEGNRIYLWLQGEGAPEPRAYELPWDRELAEQLQEAGREAALRGTALRARLPAGRDGHGAGDEEPLFYAAPQPAAPEKEMPPEALRLPTGPG